jgi:hypothetical protein
MDHPNKTAGHTGSESAHDKADRKRDRLDAALELGLEETFPGSDPVAVTQPPHSPLDRKDARKRQPED